MMAVYQSRWWGLGSPSEQEGWWKILWSFIMMTVLSFYNESWREEILSEWFSFKLLIIIKFLVELLKYIFLQVFLRFIWCLPNLNSLIYYKILKSFQSRILYKPILKLLNLTKECTWQNNNKLTSTNVFTMK